MNKQIQTLLRPDHPWKDRLHWFDTIDSTNTEAKRMAQKGAPHGTVLLAHRQTGGRGRMGRSFSSPAGMGIYLSVILRPECRAEQLMHLTCATAVAMCDAVETVTGFRPGVKWINDLIADGKKLGGILTELSILPGSDKIDFAVVGIGINCNQTPLDFSGEIRDIAISLQTATQKPVQRCQLAAGMIEALWKMSETLLIGEPEIMEQYKADCITLGQDIYLLRSGQKLPCHALDLDQEGALIVQHPDGSVETVCSGEVSVRRR